MLYTELLERQIIGRLKVDNPWWTDGSIPSFYKNMSPRLYLDIFYPLVKDTELRRSVILMGSRRVGKTVMLFHTIQRLINDGVSPQNIIYISVETPIYDNILLEQLFNLSKQTLRKPENDDSKYYVFFDEIQYLKDWEVNLKSLVDTYKSVKFIASGSAAAELRKKSLESGAGRFTDFNLPPLLFYEYVHLKGYSNIMTQSKIGSEGSRVEFWDSINVEKLNSLFIDYINFGGYPEVGGSEKIRENPGQFIRHDIIDKVLLRDLPSLYGIRDVQELNSVFTMIAYHSGDQFSYEKMSNESGVQKHLLRNYIEYLQAAFLIKLVRRTDDTARQYRRDVSFKLYLTNPSLRCALFQPIDSNDAEIGNMVETAVYSQWFPRQGANISYANWRTGRVEGEVDIVGIDAARQRPSWGVEVKWTDRYSDHVGELESLLFFLKKNKLSSAIVTTRSVGKTQEVADGPTLYFIPVACYAYTVGMNTLTQAKKTHGGL